MPDRTVCALIAAAGRGSRAGLPYPKTLFTVQERPILLRVADVLGPQSDRLVVVASPEGAAPIRHCLDTAGVAAQIAVQDVPRGMGDAVLCAEQASHFAEAEHVLLAWGDIPFLQTDTVSAMVAAHLAHGNDLTFATALSDSAYTVVSRDAEGRFMDLRETRESGDAQPTAGERDIGLFIFRRAPMLEILRRDLPGKFGKATGEHGFLYAFAHLAAAGAKIAALPIATELDLVSLNSLSDVAAYLLPGEAAG